MIICKTCKIEKESNLFKSDRGGGRRQMKLLLNCSECRAARLSKEQNRKEAKKSGGSSDVLDSLTAAPPPKKKKNKIRTSPLSPLQMERLEAKKLQDAYSNNIKKYKDWDNGIIEDAAIDAFFSKHTDEFNINAPNFPNVFATLWALRKEEGEEKPPMDVGEEEEECSSSPPPPTVWEEFAPPSEEEAAGGENNQIGED